MKLFDEVREAICPAVGVSCPFCSKPVAMTLGSSAVKEKKKHYKYQTQKFEMSHVLSESWALALFAVAF